MGYVFMLGMCVGCRKMISFNPNKVPSVRINGEKEPLCEECATQINKNRAKAGMEVCVIHKDAWEAIPEEEL